MLFGTLGRVEAKAVLPDSLMAVEGRMVGLVKEIEQYERVITTPDEMEFFSPKLAQLRDSRQRMQTLYPLSDHDELWSLVTRFDNCDRRILEKMKEWERRKQRIELDEKIAAYEHTMDSLLAKGREYAERKSADSVRSVKLRAEDQWQKVGALKASNAEEFDSEITRQRYKNIESARAQIQDLSEKEKLKVRDVILVVAAVVAAVAMLLTLARSISLTKKGKKTDTVEI